MNAATLLIPEASLILTGYFLKRHSGWTLDFWMTSEKLVYYVMFPALLFNSIVRTPLSVQAAGPAMLVAVGAILCGALFGYAAKLFLKVEPMRFASGVQCAFRFNSYVALAMAERVGGQPGLALAAMVLGVTVPLCNLLAVYPLARHSGQHFGRELLKNPLVLATLLGLLGNLAGLHLPEPISLTLQKLGAGALPLGLICVGTGISFGETRRDDGKPADHAFNLWIQFVKSFAVPAVAWLGSRAVGLGPVEKSVITLFAAMPTASAAYILANRMGGDGPFVARLITASLVVSMFALPFWLSLM